MLPALKSAMSKPVATGTNGLFYTPVFRLAFPHLDAPWGGDPVKNIPPAFTFLGVFDDDADLSQIENALKASLVTKFGKGAINLLGAGAYRYPLRPKMVMAEKYSGFEGSGMFGSFRARADAQPACIDMSQGKQVLLQLGAIERSIYAGCYCYATCTIYAFDKGGGKGVSLGVRTLVKVADGERFGGMAPTSKEEAVAATTAVSLPGLITGDVGSIIDGKAEEVPWNGEGQVGPHGYQGDEVDPFA